MLESIRIWSELGKLDKKDVLARLYGLNETEAETYFLLAESGLTHVSELSSKISKDRTTAQRIATRLVDEQLAHRRKINLANGGIKYAYEAVPFSTVKLNMHSKLERWYSLSRKRIVEL